MSASALTNQPLALFSAADSALGSAVRIGYTWEKGPNQNDVLILHRVPLFRSGNFQDSFGYDHTWDDLHIHEMVSHYNLLKDTRIFEHVPVRKDHPSFLGGAILDNVIGYHRSLVAEKLPSPIDGTEYTYLLGDLEIIDTDAQKSIMDGKWRCRSAEVGSWITNNKSEYWPVFMGLAYVDIGAVEGLNFAASVNNYVGKYQKNSGNFTVMMEERMSSPIPQPPQVPKPGTTTPPPQPPVAPAPPAAAPAPPAATTTDHGSFVNQFEFSLGTGKKTSNYAEVQAYIEQLETRNNNLETVQREAEEAERENFAKSLVQSGRVLATKETDTVNLCKNMTPEQFASYKSIMDDAPVNPLLGKYGSQPANGAPGSQQHTAADQKADHIEVLKEQIKLHRMSGKTPDQIRQFGSFKELETLDKSAAEAAVK